jgi:hypothetical protein
MPPLSLQTMPVMMPRRLELVAGVKTTAEEFLAGPRAEKGPSCFLRIVSNEIHIPSCRGSPSLRARPFLIRLTSP